ncbi:MAG TPA: S8 family serine peptidase [Planctomycetes bacterium]|nr:S8 family serine peptidase [Planctomycetota bacterium]
MSQPVIVYRRTISLRVFVVPAILMSIMLCTATADGGDELYRLGLQPAALDYTGTFEMRDIDPALTGKGVTIASVCRSFTYLQNIPLNDYRLNMQHKCFSAGSVSFVDGLGFEPEISEHSTAIGAILVGTDPNAYHPQLGRFQYAGAAPEAQLDVYEFWRFIVNYVFGNKSLEADVLTMSIGSTFDDWWTRGINHIADANGLIVIASIGNGSDVFDPPLYPGAGANVIGVGVVDSIETGDLSRRLTEFSLPHYEHSSAGPTSDSRCKPDIVAPGNCIAPDANSTSRYDITGDWSSFAAPVVAGTCALLVQKAKSEPDLNSAVAQDGGNCVMKAILMNSATKLPYWHKGAADKADDPYVCLDYTQGAGLLNAKRAYELLIAGPARPLRVPPVGWDNNTLEIKDSTENVYRMDVSDTAGNFITATLVWNRRYEGKYPFESLSQPADDMRLELWAVDPNGFYAGYLMDYSDSINDNVEHIHCRVDPNYTTYEIVVTFSSSAINSGSDLSQRYGLAWNVHTADNRDSTLWYDLNYDGSVDALDFTILFKNLDRPADSDAGYLLGDINMDGVIDINDVAILMERMSPKS